jgi:quercetin dioxygenase-like cupin family protein
VFDQELPNVPGKSMRAVLVEYEPGSGSPSHRHPSSAFIYARVLEGAIRSKVNDEPERTYQAGESWSEKPGDHHQVSHNASNTDKAKLLAIFVVDTNDRNIVIPANEKQPGALIALQPQGPFRRASRHWSDRI